MNDEQCESLVKAINELTEAISNGASNIVGAIDDIYSASNEGIERCLDKIVYAIDTIPCN